MCHQYLLAHLHQVDALEHQVALSILPVPFLDGRDVASRMVSWAAVVLPVCFLHEWMWSPYSSMTWRPQAQTRRSLTICASAGSGILPKSL